MPLIYGPTPQNPGRTHLAVRHPDPAPHAGRHGPLAHFLNHELYQGDNGRVIGYDNAHGYHHRHYRAPKGLRMPTQRLQ